MPFLRPDEVVAPPAAATEQIIVRPQFSSIRRRCASAGGFEVEGVATRASLGFSSEDWCVYQP